VQVAITILLSAALMLALVLWLPLGIVLASRLSLPVAAVAVRQSDCVSPSLARSRQTVHWMALLPQRAPPAERTALREERTAPPTFPVRWRGIEPGNNPLPC
jgi:hypothetical protein